MIFCIRLFEFKIIETYPLNSTFMYSLVLLTLLQCSPKPTPDSIPLPVPECIIGLSADLDPDGQGGGEVILKAEDFMVSKIRHPKGQGAEFGGLKEITVYSVNRLGNDANKNSTTIRFDCADVGKEVKLELHAWDSEGNHGFCVCYAEIVDLKKTCKN